MTETMKSFLEKLGKDENLQNKLKECKSPEEAFEFAKGVVDGLCFDDFVTTMQKVNEAITKNQGELSDEDLEQVAGGWGWSDSATPTVVGGGVSRA